MTRVLNETTRRLECMDFDFNADGRVDFSQFMDASASWVRKEAADLDGDSAFDVVSIFEKSAGSTTPQLVLQEFKARFENRPSVWKEYLDSRLVRRGIDRRGLGRPDYRESYENGRLVRIERDDDSDGRPDRGPRYPVVATPVGPEPGKPLAR